MGGKRDPCAGCVYYVRTGDYQICDYLLRTKHRRPCPFGAGCTVKQTEGSDAEMSRKTWDKATALKLWEEGKTDPEIAKALGIALNTVYQWRRKENLRSNFGPNAVKKPPEAAAAEAETPEEPVAVEPPDRSEPEENEPGSPPDGPVELHLELCGGWARLRAPSWEQAARLWKMLDVCVEALEREGGDG